MKNDVATRIFKTEVMHITWPACTNVGNICYMYNGNFRRILLVFILWPSADAGDLRSLFPKDLSLDVLIAELSKSLLLSKTKDFWRAFRIINHSYKTIPNNGHCVPISESEQVELMETVHSTDLAACNICFGKCFADHFCFGSDIFSETQQISLCLFQCIGFMPSISLRLLGKCQ